MTKNKIIEYIFNLRTKTPRKNYYLSHRRVARGDGHKTMGWVLSDEQNVIAEKIKFVDIMKEKKKLEKINA